MDDLEFKKWIDDKKEPDGSIDLSKHEDLKEYLLTTYAKEKSARIEYEEFLKITEGLGSTISYDLTKWKKNDI